MIKNRFENLIKLLGGRNLKNKLEKLLLEKGVCEFHIKEMKETKNISV
jgi:hypothetical protein